MIDFPITPTLNQQYTEGDRTWKCVKIAPAAIWDMVAVSTSDAEAAGESALEAAAAASDASDSEAAAAASAADAAATLADAAKWSTIPISSTSSGTAGQIAGDSSYFYVCYATNLWRRCSVSAW